MTTFISPTAEHEVLGLLGSGGDGAVYLALRRVRPADSGRLCALKMASDSAASERLGGEWRLLSSLDHPGIPKPLELFAWDGKTCLATEHRQGRTLDLILRQKDGPLPPADVLGWAVQAAGILAYLHRQPAPVVHRDVKPANLLLTDDGQILLLDFGASRRFNQAKPTDTIALGSPEFAAPEQFQAGGQTGPFTDVWGLAATCYRLLTNVGPERLFTFAPLRDLLPSAPVLLEGVLERALQYEPAARYPSAVELKADLARALAVLAGRAADTPRLPAPPQLPAPRSMAEAAQAETAAAATGSLPAALRPGRGAGRGRFRAAATPPAPARAEAGSRLVLVMALLSPVFTGLFVALTVYLALSARNPLPFGRQPLGLNGAGEVVETGLGQLVVNSEPAGATVELDGTLLQNRTPLMLSQLPSGSHSLTVRLPGYAAAEKTVDINPGVVGDVVVSLIPLVRVALGVVDEEGAWTALNRPAVAAEQAGRLAFRVLPAGLEQGPSGSTELELSRPVTLQVVLRLPDGSTRTAFSGSYLWKQLRRLNLGALNPGSYTVEATVVGANFPPVTQSASFDIKP